MPVQIFLSAVTDEFRDYRDQLRSDLTRHNVEVKVQEDFKDHGGTTLDKLDAYIKQCDAVVHLVGDMTGSEARTLSMTSITTKYPDIFDRLPPLHEALKRGGAGISYTQWEAWLAVYHFKMLLIAKADEAAPRGPKYAPSTASRAAQTTHLERLRKVERYPGSTFTSCDNLAKQIAYTAILDLLAKDRGDAHSSALADSLIDMATMVFVDVMRLMCVAGSDTARSVNQSRYVEFVDVADLHLSEFSNHLARITAHLGSDAIKACHKVETGLAFFILRLRRGPGLDRSWREFVGLLKDLAERVDDLAGLLCRDYYNKKVEDVISIIESAVQQPSTVINLDVPDTFVHIRFRTQSAVLDRVREMGRLTIRTIRDDIDQRLAIPYFIVDRTLLQAAAGSASPPLS
ncbi:DUF4062 domain-containing protein [Mesorhizobium sp. M0977]|uniref:DUF4062 domain-containing protein n=1 Tax=Mesorhizobium sp. M0977 TaxID=2957039 RepID=UPI00333DD394